MHLILSSVSGSDGTHSRTINKWEQSLFSNHRIAFDQKSNLARLWLPNSRIQTNQFYYLTNKPCQAQPSMVWQTNRKLWSGVRLRKRMIARGKKINFPETRLKKQQKDRIHKRTKQTTQLCHHKSSMLGQNLRKALLRPCQSIPKDHPSDGFPSAVLLSQILKMKRIIWSIKQCPN